MLRALESPFLQHREGRVVRIGLAAHRRLALHAELAEKPARLPRPRDEQVPLRAREADVEESPLLRYLRRGFRELDRQLLLLDVRDEHRLELEPLRAVQRQEMDTAA